LADDNNEPKGILTLSVQLAAPGLTETLYKQLNHPFQMRNIPIVDIPCTQNEARALTDKVRKANPHDHFLASWTGGTLL
jgi:tRNA isopentenyl-2-thiomethyl-A-37 hydroxylase MiaE